MSGKLSDFVAFPRQLFRDYLTGKLETNELILLATTRGTSDAFGVRHISHEEILYDIFKGKSSVNYINKLLLSLKKKRYLWYEERRGKKGAFDIYYPDCIRSDKSVSSIDHFYDTPIEDKDGGPSASQRSDTLSQKSKDIKNDISKFLDDIPFD